MIFKCGWRGVLITNAYSNGLQIFCSRTTSRPFQPRLRSRKTSNVGRRTASNYPVK